MIFISYIEMVINDLRYIIILTNNIIINIFMQKFMILSNT